jgi:uncharacterized membrane protein YfcA
MFRFDAMTDIQWLLIGLSAVAAGAVNALAGGGTLITFPILIAIGIPAVVANITNTVALCPGYLAATFAQRKQLSGQRRRLCLYLPVGLLGGTVGGFLLLHTGEQAFRALVPYLILFAAGLLAAQDLLRAWLLRRSEHPSYLRVLEKVSVLPALLASIYGGYFGAGVSVIVLAVLGLMLDDSLTRLNALKQGISFAINIAAATFFIFTGIVDWPVATVMAVGALIGGALGGRMAGRIKPAVLRWIVVAVGVGVAGVYLVR